MARIRVRDVILEDMQPVIWGTTIPFAIICPISCAIRLYARKFISKSFGLDDWFMFVGSFVWIGQQYIAWMWTILGGGLHSDAVSSENVAKIYLYLFVEEFYYLLLQFIIKMSFLCFYRRAFSINTKFLYGVYAVMALVTCQTVGTWLFYGLQCIPIDAYFHPELYPDAKCIASDMSYYLPSVANVMVDVVIYLLPIMPLWNIQAPKRRRLEIIGIFTLGGGAVMVSLLRFIVLWQLSTTSDPTYIFGSVTIVTSIEFAAAIITANTPGMAGFYNNWRETRRSKMGFGGSGGREFELGDVPTIGSWPRKHNATNSTPSRDDTHGRSDSEEELTPHVEAGPHYLHKPRSTVESAKDVRVDTEVVISREAIRGNSLGKKDSATPTHYYQFT